MTEALAPRATSLQCRENDAVLNRLFASSPILSHDIARFTSDTPMIDSNVVPISTGELKQTYALDNITQDVFSEMSPLERVSIGNQFGCSTSHLPSKPQQSLWSSQLPRVAHIRETKTSSVISVHNPFGRKHGSIRIKPQISREEYFSFEDDTPSMPGSLPWRTETPLCTKIAHSESSKSKAPPFRKPPPCVVNSQDVHEKATSKHCAAILDATYSRALDNHTGKNLELGQVLPICPPPRPPKSSLRRVPTLFDYSTTRGPSLAHEWQIKMIERSDMQEAFIRTSDVEVPALISDSDSESFSSVDAL